MNRKKHEFLHPGFSSILIVFLILCLVTFAVLSFMTARSDYTLSEKLAEKNTQYYEANNTAQLLLAQVDEELLALYQSADGAASYYGALPAVLENLPLPDQVTDFQTDVSTDDVTASFTVRMSDTRCLAVTLDFIYPELSGDNCYKITQWQTVTDTGAASDSNTLHLYTGDTP